MIETRLQATIALFLLCAVSAPSVNATEKTIDLRTDKSEAGRYELRFSAIKTAYDHAYVGFFAEDMDKRMSLSSYVGFYPASSPRSNKAEQLFEFLVKGVQGTLAEEDKQTLATPPVHQLTARVSRSAYRKAEAARDRWKEGGTYRYGINDCVSFANEIAAAAGIETPSTIANPGPISYVEALVDSN